MSQLPRPLSEPVAVRARGHELGYVRFWALSDTEVATARSESLRAARGAAPSGSPAYADVYGRQMESRVVASAARSVSDIWAPALPGAIGLLAELTEDEMTAMFAAYAVFRAGVGPILSNITPESMEACIVKLAKGADLSGLDVLRWGSADRLSDVPGIDASAGFLDCHFLCWCAARRVLYPDSRSG